MAVEVEDDLCQVQNIKSKPSRRSNRDETISLWNRKLRGIILVHTKPSYALKQGVGSSKLNSRSFRAEHRKILRHLLRKLVHQRNWNDASGVLSVLLGGTLGEKCILENRTKYWSALQLLKHMKGDYLSKRNIQRVFDTWMKKNGPMKQWPVKDRYLVQLELIRLCLSYSYTDDAHQVVISLMQERGFGSDPISNLVAGLTFWQLWYSVIPEELQLRGFDRAYSPVQSETDETKFDMSIWNSEECGAQESNYPFQCDSNSSVRIDKEIASKLGAEQKREISMEVDDAAQRETVHLNLQVQGLYINSPGSSGHEETASHSHGGYMPFASIFNVRGLEPGLLPLRLPRSNESLEQFRHLHGTMRNAYYTNAVKYLQLALNSTPPQFEALLPLIQILLLGDEVKKALDELDKFLRDSNTAYPLRLKANLLDCFDSKNIGEISACFEGSLKKDPKCSRSLERLVSMHQNGVYSAERLLEMLALYSDATNGDVNSWKEFALCFLKLSESEEDRMSICLDTDGVEEEFCAESLNRAPAICTNGFSGKTWRFRCRWWLTRFFCRSTLASEIAAGDLQLVCYKAAVASHMYGREHQYVLKASACFEQENDMDLFSFLQMHMLNSAGFYFKFNPRN